MRIAQLTDTHVVEPDGLCHGLDTGAYFSAAIEAVNRLEPRVDFTILTGDLTDHGRKTEYAHFGERAQAFAMPWAVIPGNHDDADNLRTQLPSVSYGGVESGPITYALDLGAVRLVGIDANLQGPSIGARLTDDAAAWLERTLGDAPTPTMLAVHQPPFSSGLWYLDIFGFGGAHRLRKIVERHAHVGRVVSGHIHCVRKARWRHALACSAPSSAPQFVPMFHELDVHMQEPGFAIHDYDPVSRWTTTIHRRCADRFEATQRLADY